MLGSLLLTGCTGQRLDLYTLDAPPAQATAHEGAVVRTLVVSRVEIPLELDNDDMLVADGPKFRRSTSGRWASRLSALVTRRLSQRLADDLPDILVTDQTLGSAPDARLSVRIATLAVAADGTARLEADWRLIASGPAGRAPPQRFQETIEQTASSDQGLHDGVARLLDDLAARIATSLTVLSADTAN